MLEYFFSPLNEQFDDGFGAVGNAFKESAENLSIEGNGAFLHGHLPINFLYRHSIELFFKGMITILHRTLELTSGDTAYSREPKVLVGEKWKRIYQVHSLSALYSFYKSVVTSHSSKLEMISKTDWANTPDELDRWIASIDAADQGSTLFRYPVTQNLTGDIKKASFQNTTTEDILAIHKANGKPVKALMVFDENDEVGKINRFIQEPMDDIKMALEGAAELLSIAHFGLMADLKYSEATFTADTPIRK